MERQKNNSVLITLIVILILLLLGTCGYILYDKGLIGKPNEVNKEENKRNDKQEQVDNDNKQEQSSDNNQFSGDKGEVNKLSSYEVECTYGLVPYIESLFVETNEYDKNKG